MYVCIYVCISNIKMNLNYGRKMMMIVCEDGVKTSGRRLAILLLNYIYKLIYILYIYIYILYSSIPDIEHSRNYTAFGQP